MLVYSPGMIATLYILSKTQSALAQVEGRFLNYRACKQVAVSRVTSATSLVSFAQHSQRAPSSCAAVCASRLTQHATPAHLALLESVAASQ